MTTRPAGDDRFRALPAIDKVAAALDTAAPSAAAGAARRAVDEARERIRAGEPAPSFEAVVDAARTVLAEQDRGRIQRVINATGVLVHTNLGRVPLGEDQLAAVAGVAAGYSNLEYELAGGRRGSRYVHARRALATLTGAEAALVVNNNAAAVLLTLAALAPGREVVISRGELVEIGGEFRIPDVMAISGAKLVEVGTTNRTHLADYERAITERTAVILKVHPSNYRMIGFTAAVPARDLARLARGRKLWFVHDVGSGLVAPEPGTEWLAGEPVVEQSLAEGADVVTFSGDKLFGGPQAGIVVGREAALEKIGRHPLLRALRPDKMTFAALEATAAAYLEGRARALPLWRMALTPAAELETRAVAAAARLRERVESSGTKVEAVPAIAVTGGGSLPGAELDSWAISVSDSERSAAEIGRALRFATTPVVCRIEADVVLLDLRTVAPEDDDLLVETISAALAPPGRPGPA